jgi:tagatose-1,6-bisphosphate aldolase non-catalytic subunit AgaZ/GatZ
MARAGELVRAFVEAGFVKIHLDASMSCSGDAAHRLPLRIPQDWLRTDVRLSRSYIRHGGDGVRPGRDSKVVRAMDADPPNWRDYIPPGAASRLGRLFALSDRVRYYWTDPGVAGAIAARFARVDSGSIPSGLLSQFKGSTLSERLVQARVGAVVARYGMASHYSGGPKPISPKRSALKFSQLMAKSTHIIKLNGYS